MSEANYVLEVAKLIRRLQLRGYAVPRLMKRLKRHLFLYPDTFGKVNAFGIYQQINSVLDILCQSTAFEAVTESECGLQDYYTRLLQVGRSTSVSEGEDLHLIDLWQLAGLDPADDEDCNTLETHDWDALEGVIESEDFDSEISELVEVIDTNEDIDYDSSELEEVMNTDDDIDYDCSELEEVS